MNSDEHVEARRQEILNSSYRLAEDDPVLLQRNELRPVRLQLELLKPEMALAEHGIHSTIVVFGGTQIVERDSGPGELAAARAGLAAAPDDPHAGSGRLAGRAAAGQEPLLRRRPRVRPPGLQQPAKPTARATTSSSPAAGRASWRRPTAARTTSAQSRSA